jgi:phospholipid/cholesterol/gamma-HCH transport system substrate-binding protein
MAGQRFSKKTLVKVVLFAVVSILFTFGLAMRIGNLHPFSHTYKLTAQFTDATGVFKGDAVKLAGVDVGRVQGAKIENGQAFVTFTVNKGVRLTTDSVVGIRWRNVLGQRFLYLYPGDGQGRQLQDGDVVPVSRTETAGDLGEFLNHLGPILKAIDPQKANAFIDAMNTALVGNEAAVRALIGNGATLADRLGQMDQQVKTLIGSSNTVVTTYANQDKAIASIIDSLAQLGGRLHGMTGDINSVVSNFADVQNQLNRLLTENRQNIDVSLSELDSVLTNLSRNKSNLARTLCTLPAGLSNYFDTTSWGEWFNVRIIGFSLKNRQSQLAGGAGELPSQHSSKVRPPFTCGRPVQIGPPPGSGVGGQGSQGGPGAPQGGSAPGFQNLDALLQFILRGQSHG